MDTNFDNKTLLITGGTGSFGNAVLKQFLKTKIKEIRIFSRDEKKQDEMRLKYQSEKLKFFLGDVREINSIYEATKDVDYVFHAAALKQVPSCEFFPLQAVETNILGASNLLESAYRNNVSKVVVLSTDKAVYPINSMGISKAMMEKVMIAKSRYLDPNKQVFCGTRYGNVMGSRGSVIPLFITQIKEEKPITITDPSMTRFMMSLDESVDLVKFAFNHAVPGDIFVQKAPSCTILDLAKALIEIFNSKSEIKIIGTRHGEKVHETLCNREEMTKAIDLGSFYRIPSDNRDLNYSLYLEKGTEKSKIAEEFNSYNTKQLNVNETIELLIGLDIIKEELK
ncbi:MAG: polysaccharide biosynthesis protein [Bacteroidales bacterium]|nr:polysaccharide biosynthesis protein [Bacteroidales bacterium]